MLANVGVVVAQLFSLQQADSGFGFGYLAVGKPLATLCLSASIAIVVLGVVRTWRYQRALIRGKALSGGPELMLVGAGLLVVGVIWRHLMHRTSLGLTLARSPASSLVS